MSSNIIVTRVKDFLKKYPPYSYLSDEVLMEVASTVQIFYFQDNEYVFEENQPNAGFIYILKKGRIELFKEFEQGIELIDVCDNGDLFGVRSLLTENSYTTSARVSGDALVYGVPKSMANKILEKYPQVSLFFAAGFASGQTIIHTDFQTSKKARRDLLQFQRSRNLKMTEEDVLMLNSVKDVVSCTKDTTIREAAEKMKVHRVGSVVVIDENNHPIGIVTDTDFTRKVIAGELESNDVVEKLMAKPVATLPPNTTVAQFTIRSIRKSISRLVITEDGTNQSPVVGILSERDILSMHGNHPTVLVKRILKARTIEKLKKLRNRVDEIILNYLEQEVSIEFVADIITEINEVLIHKAIDISLKKLEQEGITAPNLKWAWLSLGSEGRGEQLLRTDQDNAIVYENPKKEDAEIVKDYFLKLGSYVVEVLVECGYERCKGGIMASNPKWTQPLAAWKNQFENWIETSDANSVMHGNIFFDFKPTYGDIEMAYELSDFIFKMVEKHSGRFAWFFVSNAIDTPPPLSFFKNFIVERSGKHKNMFDIKKRAMLPLAGAARMLMIDEQIKGVNNTFERYRKLAELYPNEKTLFEEAGEAYEIFMRYRALNGFRNKNSGRFIQPVDLNKIERQTLRTAFKSIDEIQTYLRLRFNLGIN